MKTGPARDIKKTGKKIALFGAGPSILTAASFLHLLGHDIVFFSQSRKSPDFGRTGQQRREMEKLLAREITIEAGSPEELEHLIGNPQGFDAVCFQEAPESPPDDYLMGAVQFRRLLKEKSITPGSRAAIIGHGAQAARTAALLQEMKVDYLVLTDRSPDDCPELAGKDNIRWNTRVIGFKGKKGEGGFLVAAGDDEEYEIPTDRVILALGPRNDLRLPLPRLVSGLPLVELPFRLNKDYNSGLLESMAWAKGAAMALDLALKHRPIEDISRCLVGGRGAISFEAYLDPETDPAGREIASYKRLNTSCFTRQERLSPSDGRFQPAGSRDRGRPLFSTAVCAPFAVCAPNIVRICPSPWIRKVKPEYLITITVKAAGFAPRNVRGASSGGCRNRGVWAALKAERDCFPCLTPERCRS